MGISNSLPLTGYIKMIDIWMIFTMSYPFIVIMLHCLQKVSVERVRMEHENITDKGISPNIYPNFMPIPIYPVQIKSKLCMHVYCRRGTFANSKHSEILQVQILEHWDWGPDKVFAVAASAYVWISLYHSLSKHWHLYSQLSKC